MQTSTQDDTEVSRRHSSLKHTIKNDVSVIIAFAQLVSLNPKDPKVPAFLSKIESRSRMILANIDTYLKTETTSKS